MRVYTYQVSLRAFQERVEVPAAEFVYSEERERECSHNVLYILIQIKNSQELDSEENVH